MRFLSIIKDFNNNLRQLMREYLLVILCAVLLAIDTASAVIVQDNNRGVFQCPDLFGHYPDASDCSKYYVCDHGQTLEHTCNNGLVFNTELKTCDWRRNVECDTTNGNRGDHSTRNGYSDQSLAAAPESEADYPESISDVEYNKYPEYADDQAKDDPPPPPPPMPTPKPSPTPYRLPPPQRQPPPVPRRPPQTTLRPQIINARYGPRAAIEDEDDSPGVRIFDDNDEENDHKQNRFQAPNLVSNGFRPISSPISNNRLQNSHTYRPSPPSPSPTPRINHDITMQNRHTYRPSPPSPSPTPRINYDITRIPSNNDRPNSQYDNDALHEEDSNGTSPHDHSHDHNHDHEHDHHNRNHHNHNHDNHHNHENHENHDHSDYDHSPEHDPDYDYAHYDDYEEPPEDYHETHEDEGPPQNQINVPPPTPPQPTPQYKTSRPLQITISRRPSVPITRSPKPQNSNTDNNARNAHNSMPNAKRSPAVKRTGWLPNDADNAELDEFHWSMGDAESFAHEKPRIPEEAFVKLTDFKKIEKEISKYNRMPNTDNNNQVPPNDQSSDEGPPHHHQRPPQSLVGNGDYKYTYGGVDSSHYKPKRVFTLNTSNRANPKPQSRNLLRDPEDNVSRNFASGMKPTPVRMVNSHPVRPTGFAPRYNSKRQVHTIRPNHYRSHNHNHNHRAIHSHNHNHNHSHSHRPVPKLHSSRPPMISNSVRQGTNPFRGNFVKSVPRSDPLMNKPMPNQHSLHNHPRTDNNSLPIVSNVNAKLDSTTPPTFQIINDYQKDLPDAALRTRKFSQEFRDAILDNYMFDPKPAYILDDGDFGNERPKIPMIDGENGEEEEEEGEEVDEIRDIEKDIAELHAKKQSTDKSKNKNNNNNNNKDTTGSTTGSTTGRTTKVPENNSSRSTSSKKKKPSNSSRSRSSSKSRNSNSSAKKLVKSSTSKESRDPVHHLNTTFTVPNHVTDSVDKNYEPLDASLPVSKPKPTVSLNTNEKPNSRYLNTDAIVKQQRLLDSPNTRPQPVIKISVQSTTQKTPKKSNSATQQRNQTTVRPRSAKIRSKNNNNNTNNSNNNNNNNSTNKPPKKRPPQRNQSKPKSATRTTTKHTTSKPTFPMTTVPTPVIAKPITIPKPKLKVHINIPTRPQSPQTTREVQSQTPSKTPSTWNHAITKTQDIYDDDTRPSPPATRGAWNKQVTSGQNDKDLTKDFYLEERSQTPTKPNTSKQIVTENGDEIYDDEPEDKVIENHDAVDVEKNARSTPPQSKSFILSANKDFDETERPQLSPKPNSWTQAVTNKQEDYANDKGSSETVPNNWNNGVTKAQDVYENAKRMPNFPKPNAWNPPKPQQPVQPVIQSQALNPNTFILSVPENQNPSNEEPPKSIPKIISWNFHGVPNTPQQPRKPDVAQTTPKPNNWNQPKPRNLDSREEVRPWNVPKQTNWNQEVPKTADVVKEEKPQTSPQPKQQLPKSNEKESTRSSPKASWNKEDPIYDYYEYDKVVSPPNQNKNKNTNNNNRNNGQWQKPVAPVVSRPNSQPVPYQKAEKCFDDICIEPNCRCGGIYIPGGHSTNQVPQIVLLTFDDSVNDLNWDIYEELFSSGRKNPNGCPILGTFYVSHEWTDYGQIQTLYSRGHEMASHSITHSFGEKFSKEKWLKEIAGMRELMHLYGGVKPEDVRGMRAPFLQTGGNTMFEMLYDANFTYDSSLPVYDISPPYYPYTLDYAINHECMITPCPSNSYPGLWEVGMVMWQDLRGGRCSMADACFNPKDEQGVYDMLKNNFDRHYTSNRAPFGIFYHSRWFLTEHNRKGFVRFLDEILALGDVYLQTNHQMIEWMKNPTPLSQIKNFKPWQCSASDRPQECRRAHECKVKHKSETRSFRTCQSCPKSYPWFANNGL